MQKRPTWQCSGISDLPSVCQPSNGGYIAKKHKNKLLAIAAVPMGTGPPRVRPLRRSSAQTARYPTPLLSGGGALSRGGLLISVSDLSCQVPQGGWNTDERFLGLRRRCGSACGAQCFVLWIKSTQTEQLAANCASWPKASQKCREIKIAGIELPKQ